MGLLASSSLARAEIEWPVDREPQDLVCWLWWEGGGVGWWGGGCWLVPLPREENRARGSLTPRSVFRNPFGTEHASGNFLSSSQWALLPLSGASYHPVHYLGG